MTFRFGVAATALVLWMGASAWAQDDDLLAPLVSPSKKKAAKTKKVKSVKPKRVVEPPEPEAPVAKTELWVKLPPGVRGARLLVDDKDITSLPSGPVEVASGEHTVVVRRAGHPDYSRTLTFREGQMNELVPALELTTGTLMVQTDVEGAQVFVDGRSVGQAPVKDLVLAPGTYEVRVVKEGQSEESVRVAVRAGKEVPVTVHLKKPEPSDPVDKPMATNLLPTAIPEMPLTTHTTARVEQGSAWYSKWYIWAGAGAVVAGVVVTSLQLQANQNAGGKPALATVCQGICDGHINQ